MKEQLLEVLRSLSSAVRLFVFENTPFAVARMANTVEGP